MVTTARAQEDQRWTRTKATGMKCNNQKSAFNNNDRPGRCQKLYEMATKTNGVGAGCEKRHWVPVVLIYCWSWNNTNLILINFRMRASKALLFAEKVTVGLSMHACLVNCGGVSRSLDSLCLQGKSLFIRIV